MSVYEEPVLINDKNVRRRGGALRVFIAFIILTAAIAGVLTPAYQAKMGAASTLYEDLTFTRIAVEARQHIQKIEYGIRSGRELEQFYNIDGILREILRCSSYVEGVHVVGRGDIRLYKLETLQRDEAPLRRPRNMVFENENDFVVLEGIGFFDLILPIYDGSAESTAYMIVRLDSDVVLFSARDLIDREFMQSIIIGTLFLGLGLIIIVRKRPKFAGIATVVVLITFFALSFDLAISYARFSDIAESATVRSVNRIARMLQSDLDTLKAMGVSADSIHDQNSWLRKSVSGIPMIHTMSINSNMRVTLTASQEYISMYGTGLLWSYFVIYAAFFVTAAIIILRTVLHRKRKVLALVLAFLIFPLNGCSQVGGRESEDFVYVDISAEALLADMASVPPQTRADGKPFTIAYIDSDPYPITGAILYYIIVGLKDEGWITFDYLPFDPGDTDPGLLVDWLAGQDLGPYMRFDETANYYTAFMSENRIYESLSAHVQNGTVDMILSMGTGPALMAKSFELQVPQMMFGTVDPVSSGLIMSLEDPGKPNVWAVFDPTVYKRQLLYYHNLIPFNNMGIVYYNEVIAALEMYESAAASLGARVTRSSIPRIDMSSERSENTYYNDLRDKFIYLVEYGNIDAFMLTTDMILDLRRVEYLLEVFTENKIPVFVQVGEQLVEYGALMNVSAIEVEGQGIFGARSITRALTGTPLNEIPQEYRNSPFLTLNLGVADRIGFKPTFETLLASGRIFISYPEAHE